MSVKTFRDPVDSRPWKVILIDNLIDLAGGIAGDSDQFILAIAADCSGRPAAEMIVAAEGLLASGARYVCCWGPQCSLLHDVFDECAGALNEGEGVVMTTWHDQETWEDALWFATHSAIPNPAYSEASASVAVVVVGNAAWYEEACSYLGNGAPLPDEA
jgi:hypothetical protein